MSNGVSHSRKEEAKQTHPSFHVLAGLISGLSTSILLQPADLLKTRVQQSRSSSLFPVLHSFLSGPNPAASLWRGTLPSALRTGLGSALYFSSLNALRQGLAQPEPSGSSTSPSFGGEDGGGSTRSSVVLPTSSSSILPRLSGPQNLFAGAVARVFAGFWTMPITVIKVRYESDLYTYKSMVGASQDILAREGLRGFFSGVGATALRDAPYAGLYVLFYEGGKSELNTNLGRRDTGGLGAAAVNFVSGVYAAALATAVTNPFDAVKTRVQLLPGKYGNMVRATRLMLREEGARSFFDGLALRMSRKALSSALAWTVYEELIGRAQTRFSDEDKKTSKYPLQ